MPSGSDIARERDSGDKKATSQPQLRGTKSLSDLRAMAAESARINRERRLLESVREIYTEDWQREGLGPHPDNTTAKPALLKVLCMPDWPDKLRKRGIEVNEPTTLQLISQKLKRIDPSNLRDYNTAVSNFNKTVQDLKRDIHKNLQKDDLEGYERLLRDTEQLLVKPAGLEGGVGYWYNRHLQEYYGRIITLRDPEGRVHVFNRGESYEDIAYLTSRCIDDYRNQYANRRCSLDSSNQRFEHYKNQYRVQALTEDQAQSLRVDHEINGWKCIQRTYPTLQENIYYTDKGTKITALNLSNYQPWSREEHDISYPPTRYDTIGDPTPIYNCHSIFIGRKAWLVPEKRGEYHETQIKTILNENGYYRAYDAMAQVGDIIAYYRPNGSILHTAIIARILFGVITAESKMGDFSIIRHDMYDDRITKVYGKPIIYHTNRAMGHLLIPQEVWEEAKVYSGYKTESENSE